MGFNSFCCFLLFYELHSLRLFLCYWYFSGAKVLGIFTLTHCNLKQKQKKRLKIEISNEAFNIFLLFYLFLLYYEVFALLRNEFAMSAGNSLLELHQHCRIYTLNLKGWFLTSHTRTFHAELFAYIQTYKYIFTCAGFLLLRAFF